MDMLEQSLDSSASHDKQETEEVVQLQEGEAVGTEEQTAVTITGVPQAAFADHNVQYQFRTENSGGQVTYRVVQVTDDQLEATADGTGAVSVVSTAAFAGAPQAVAQAVIQNPFSNGGSPGGETVGGETRFAYFPAATVSDGTATAVSVQATADPTITQAGGEKSAVASLQNHLLHVPRWPMVSQHRHELRERCRSVSMIKELQSNVVWARCLATGCCCHRKPGPGETSARRPSPNILEFRDCCCNSRMSALPAKPGLRHSVSDWYSNNHELSATAQHERHVSNVIRQEGRSLRNETSCKTTWDESDTSRRLSDRAWDVARWKEMLETCAQKVDEEMKALTLSKEQTEQALAATAVPLEVSSECLTLRDGRRGYELVTDPVHEQLKKEVELIERVQEVLQQHIDKAFEQLCVLQEARHHMTADLQNKMDALDIDMSCLSLTIQSPQISLKTNPTRIPLGSSTPQEWVQFSQYNVARAQEAMQVSQQMREDMSLTRAKLQNELDTQRRATEFALRKRNHHEEQARDELEWQIRITEDEMAEMESDIHGLDADLQAKTAFLKLAHTRLENRTNRPGMDLCRDEVQHGLVDEVHQLETTIMALKQKLSEAQHSLQKMKLHHSHMLQDLSRKQEALSLEQRSMNTRTRLTSTPCTDKTPVLLVPLTNSSGRSNLQLLAQ